MYELKWFNIYILCQVENMQTVCEQLVLLKVYFKIYRNYKQHIYLIYDW